MCNDRRMGRSASHYTAVTRRSLTSRQREVVELIADGKTNGEIATTLGISLDGAKWHVSEILAKLNVESREDVAAWWRNEQRAATRVSRWTEAVSSASWVRWLAGATAAGLAIGISAAIYLAVMNDSTELASSDDARVPSTATAAPSVSATSTASVSPVATSTRPQGTPTSTAQQPGPRSTPVGGDPQALATGRLVVYTDRVGTTSEQEVVTYDLGKQRIVAVVRMPSTPYVEVDPVRRKLFFADGRSVVEAGLDGQSRRTLFTLPGQSTLIGIEASPDGRYLALGHEELPNDSGMAIIDTTTGSVIVDHPVGDFRRLGFSGAPAPYEWQDSKVHVFGYAGKDGTVWPTALVSIAGDISIVEPRYSGRLRSPSGILEVSVGDELIYTCAGSGHLFPANGIIDRSTGQRIEVLDVEGRLLRADQWSPDGTAVLLAAYEVDTRNGSDCVTFDQQPEYWSWDQSGFSHVVDVRALLKRWYGDEYIELECNGALLDTGYPLSSSNLACSNNANRPPATLIIGGRRIDTVRDAALLAFID